MVERDLSLYLTGTQCLSKLPKKVLSLLLSFPSSLLPSSKALLLLIRSNLVIALPLLLISIKEQGPTR